MICLYNKLSWVIIFFTILASNASSSSTKVLKLMSPNLKCKHHYYKLKVMIGTKIQATLFNKHIDTWKDFLKPNKSFYIAKGHLDLVNPNYYSVHKEVELAFTNNIIIKVTNIEISTHRFFVGLVSLDHVDKLPNGAILDLICVLVSVNPLIEKEYKKRREIVVTNEQYVLKMHKLPSI
ncbi:hypothetical protein R3W88_014628 [Solanum pinnatisectum]|uniref:Uncharacterized protein n=1 Tax=Solanum pinnatisectum TaxID=50273 RepID=A0AAV9KS84_9SOLN|nr:hypothetical protein R3W88_014628 [Solanum pinnatisectum]